MTPDEFHDRERRVTHCRRASRMGARAAWKGALPGVDPAVTRLAAILDDHVGFMHAIARRSGVSQHTVMGWLRRRKNPTVASLRAVLNTLGHDLRVVPIKDENDPLEK